MEQDEILKMLRQAIGMDEPNDSKSISENIIDVSFLFEDDSEYWMETT